MQEQLYDYLHAIEEKHWWFLARKKIILKLIDIYSTRNENEQILDVGCGAGMMLKALEEYGNVWGLDKSEKALGYSREKVPEAQMLLGSFPRDLPRNSFDIITVLDVLEHIDEDAKALAALKGALAPDGIAIITVPAYQFLWTNHDLANEHKRRYTVPELKQKILDAGLTIEKISYYNTFLFLPVALSKLANRFFFPHTQAHFGATPPPTWINRTLETIFSFEKRLLPFVNFPFGVSVIAVVKRT